MEKRTNKQNRSAHLWFRLLANELNGKGMDMRVVLKPEYKLRWDDKSVKENLFKPIAKALYGVDSTTNLDKKQISRVHEELMQMLVDKFPEINWVDMPSEENSEEYFNSFNSI